METQAILHHIEGNRALDRNADGAFLFEYQRAILLALKEAGRLNEKQYLYAEEKLKNQLRTFVK